MMSQLFKFFSLHDVIKFDIRTLTSLILLAPTNDDVAIFQIFFHYMTSKVRYVSPWRHYICNWSLQISIFAVISFIFMTSLIGFIISLFTDILWRHYFLKLSWRLDFVTSLLVLILLQYHDVIINLFWWYHLFSFISWRHYLLLARRRWYLHERFFALWYDQPHTFQRNRIGFERNWRNESDWKIHHLQLRNHLFFPLGTTYRLWTTPPKYHRSNYLVTKLF